MSYIGTVLLFYCTFHSHQIRLICLTLVQINYSSTNSTWTCSIKHWISVRCVYCFCAPTSLITSFQSSALRHYIQSIGQRLYGRRHLVRRKYCYPGEIHIDKNRNGGLVQGEKLKVKSTHFHRRTKLARDCLRCVIVNEDSADICWEQSYIVDVNGKYRMRSV